MESKFIVIAVDQEAGDHFLVGGIHDSAPPKCDLGQCDNEGIGDGLGADLADVVKAGLFVSGASHLAEDAVGNGSRSRDAGPAMDQHRGRRLDRFCENQNFLDLLVCGGEAIFDGGRDVVEEHEMSSCGLRQFSPEPVLMSVPRFPDGIPNGNHVGEASEVELVEFFDATDGHLWETEVSCVHCVVESIGICQFEESCSIWSSRVRMRLAISRKWPERYSRPSQLAASSNGWAISENRLFSVLVRCASKS